MDDSADVPRVLILRARKIFISVGRRQKSAAPQQFQGGPVLGDFIKDVSAVVRSFLSLYSFAQFPEPMTAAQADLRELACSLSAFAAL